MIDLKTALVFNTDTGEWLEYGIGGKEDETMVYLPCAPVLPDDDEDDADALTLARPVQAERMLVKSIKLGVIGPLVHLVVSREDTRDEVLVLPADQFGGAWG